MQPVILLETHQYLVLHKPHGLNVERLPQGFPSVEEWVHQYQVRQGVKKPYTGIVHRLDRPVSGALIVAKKKSALKVLNEQFRERQVQKFYVARVSHRPPDHQAELIHWIEKDQLNKRAIAHEHPRKKAIKSRLHYEIMQEEADSLLLLVKPITGKFHQIRVQLASIGCPIVGDSKYGSAVSFQKDGIALHARRIIFTDPLSGNRVDVEAPCGFCGA
ncbi:RluA family pseudouridine synthase [Flavilitoribacter nigricans]|uniref:RNA pseudouridine synthase n=1 Tax=Flavilitoribacter nigricans (strain ATCC 23147 / DSM 23189 / NBRC 102662 / NCIMB 1420 / SS-2) TaxID=1122177 RepID=A0A2D0NIV6_FLAN2|nr:RluA family pseudouridine synthase [Flavilitoribacter nigricans]PHN08435.1 RNA pseudouridine synthase [Flavilitoribacter nigricans DSM 23189 = NBRC 102662]